MRGADIKAIDNEEYEILLDIKMYGRRNRQYYNRKEDSPLPVVKRLKSRGFIVSVKLGDHYSYDLTPITVLLMQHNVLG